MWPIGKKPTRSELEEENRILRARLRGYESEDNMCIHLIGQQHIARIARDMAKQLAEQLSMITDGPTVEKEKDNE